MFIFKHELDKKIIVNDIKFKNYLKPYKTLIFPSHCEDILIQKKIPYILKNAAKIIIGYKIKTISEDCLFPVINTFTWKNRLLLSNEIIYYVKKNILLNNTNLPSDVIHFLLSFLYTPISP